MRVPQAEPEQPAPDRNQVTPWFAESFCTEAEKFAEVATCMVAEAGVIDTLTAGALTIVTVVEAVLEESATEATVSVTVAGVGTAVGA